MGWTSPATVWLVSGTPPDLHCGRHKRMQLEAWTAWWTTGIDQPWCLLHDICMEYMFIHICIYVSKSLALPERIHVGYIYQQHLVVWAAYVYIYIHINVNIYYSSIYRLYTYEKKSNLPIHWSIATYLLHGVYFMFFPQEPTLGSGVPNAKMSKPWRLRCST